MTSRLIFSDERLDDLSEEEFDQLADETREFMDRWLRRFDEDAPDLPCALEGEDPESIAFVTDLVHDLMSRDRMESDGRNVALIWLTQNLKAGRKGREPIDIARIIRRCLPKAQQRRFDRVLEVGMVAAYGGDTARATAMRAKARKNIKSYVARLSDEKKKRWAAYIAPFTGALLALIGSLETAEAVATIASSSAVSTGTTPTAKCAAETALGEWTTKALVGCAVVVLGAVGGLIYALLGSTDAPVSGPTAAHQRPLRPSVADAHYPAIAETVADAAQHSDTPKVTTYSPSCEVRYRQGFEDESLFAEGVYSLLEFSDGAKFSNSDGRTKLLRAKGRDKYALLVMKSTGLIEGSPWLDIPVSAMSHQTVRVVFWTDNPSLESKEMELERVNGITKTEPIPYDGFARHQVDLDAREDTEWVRLGLGFARTADGRSIKIDDIEISVCF